MQTTHLQEFVSLSKTLNFSATARAFYISQSALSRHIASLEEELGVTLFQRDSRNVSLTPAGESFAQDIRMVLNDLDQAVADLEALKNNDRRPVRIGYLHEPFTDELHTVYLLLRKYAPGLAPQFHSQDYGNLYNSLLEKRTDVALITDNDPDLATAFETVPIGVESYMLALPPGHPFIGRESVDFSELEGQPIVYPDSIGMRPFYLTAESWFAEAGFEPQIAATYYDIPSMFFHVMSGDGIALPFGCSASFHADCAMTNLTGIDTSCTLVAAWRRELPEQLQKVFRAVFGEMRTD